MATRAVLVDLDRAARQALFAETDSLASWLGIPGIDRAARASRLPEPTPRTIATVEAAAITAQAVSVLVDDLDRLRATVAFLAEVMAHVAEELKELKGETA